MFLLERNDAFPWRPRGGCSNARPIQKWQRYLIELKSGKIARMRKGQFSKEETSEVGSRRSGSRKQESSISREIAGWSWIDSSVDGKGRSVEMYMFPCTCLPLPDAGLFKTLGRCRVVGGNSLIQPHIGDYCDISHESYFGRS